MAEEKDLLGISIDADELEGLAEDADVRWLKPDSIDRLPAWNKVRICDVESVTRDNGSKYTKITFMCAKRTFRVQLSFFDRVSYRRLLPALGIKVLERRSQLMDRVVWVTFTSEINKGKEYIRIADYRDKEPDNNPAPGDRPQAGVPQQEGLDDVPF